MYIYISGHSIIRILLILNVFSKDTGLPNVVSLLVFTKLFGTIVFRLTGTDTEFRLGLAGGTSRFGMDWINCWISGDSEDDFPRLSNTKHITTKMTASMEVHTT